MEPDGGAGPVHHRSGKEEVSLSALAESCGCIKGLVGCCHVFVPFFWDMVKSTPSTKNGKQNISHSGGGKKAYLVPGTLAWQPFDINHSIRKERDEDRSTQINCFQKNKT